MSDDFIITSGLYTIKAHRFFPGINSYINNNNNNNKGLVNATHFMNKPQNTVAVESKHRSTKTASLLLQTVFKNRKKSV